MKRVKEFLSRTRRYVVMLLVAAALAGLSCGLWSGLDEVRALRRSDRIFTPHRTQADCDQDYRLWKRAVSRAADWIEH